MTKSRRVLAWCSNPRKTFLYTVAIANLPAKKRRAIREYKRQRQSAGSEYLLQSEAGVKWDINQAVNLTFPLFEVEQSSPQVADGDPSTFDVIDSEITGELQLQGSVTDNWYVSAGYSNLDGEQVSRSGPTGLRPRELPENMFSLWNNLQVTDEFALGLGLTHQDSSYINNSNSAMLPSYTRVDAAAYYDISDDFRVQINVENLTDELYFPNSHSTHQASVGAPLS